MDIFEVLDDIEYDYQRLVPRRVRKVLKPFLVVVAVVFAVIVVLVAAAPAYLWLRWTDYNG